MIVKIFGCSSSLLLLIGCKTPIVAEINYLGQKPPGMTAEVFAPGIVSTNLYEHSAPAFSPDGKSVLWTVMPATSHAYLLEAKIEKGVWSKPAVPTFNDTTADHFYPSFSADGKKLYFSSRRKVPAGYREDGDIRIWEIEQTESGWGTPLLFDTTVAKGNNYAHSVTTNGTLYFSSPGGNTNFDISKAEIKDEQYTSPTLLPFNINSIGYEDGPYISPDESFLIFESDRPEAYLSLYISFKQQDGNWSVPVNMGPKINSGKGERFAKLSPDGKYLFFGSYRDTTAGKVGADIYWIDAKIIDELRSQSLSGTKIEQPLGSDLIHALYKNDTAGSSALLKKWLSIYPTNLDATIIYSSLLRKQKRYADAEQLLNKVAVEWKTNTSIVMEKALIQYAFDKSDEAEKLLASISNEGEQARQRYLYLSEALFGMGKFDWSDRYFEKAMAIYSHGVFWYNRACGFSLIGENDRAFAALDKAIQLGYKETKQYTEDADLKPLHTDRRWTVLINKLSK